MKPRGMVSPASTRVLLAAVAVHERDGRATVRTVATEAGRTISVTHYHLRRLRDRGLVAWNDSACGTLHPTVERVSP